KIPADAFTIAPRIGFPELSVTIPRITMFEAATVLARHITASNPEMLRLTLPMIFRMPFSFDWFTLLTLAKRNINTQCQMMRLAILATSDFVCCGSRVPRERKRGLPQQFSTLFIEGTELPVKVSSPDK